MSDKLSERIRREAFLIHSPAIDMKPLEAMADEVAALEARLSEMEEALYKAAEHYGDIGAPEVHRVWRDTMVAQGRTVTDERIDWRGLPAQDIHLDERIARAVAKDFLIWAFGHGEALAGGER